jgi:membrane-bound serine protease (ClpP class)
MILIPKLIVIIVLVILLVWLHSVLSAGQWLVALFVSIIFLGVFLFFMAWVIGRLASKPGSIVGKSFVLQGRSDSSEGFVSADLRKKLLVGKRGTTLSMLRPAGKVEIEGTRIDAVSDGEFIPKDSQVEVVKVEGNRVVVRPVS